MAVITAMVGADERGPGGLLNPGSLGLTSVHPAQVLDATLELSRLYGRSTCFRESCRPYGTKPQAYRDFVPLRRGCKNARRGRRRTTPLSAHELRAQRRAGADASHVSGEISRKMNSS